MRVLKIRIFYFFLVLFFLFLKTSGRVYGKNSWKIFLDNNFFYDSGSLDFLEGSSGIVLKKGVNAYQIFGGNFTRGKDFQILISARAKELSFARDSEESKVELFRSYIKFYFYKFSFEAGKDNVQVEPGEYGLLFSKNVPPYWLVKFQTERPLKFLGEWNFTIFQGWLREERRDYSNPKLLGIRISWKPFSWLEIGGTRSTLFGGDGRPGYTIWDYWQIITAGKENEPGNKYDNDAYAGYDVSLYLPVKKIWKSARLLKIYFENAGTDLCAWWQPEDSYSECGLLGFALMNNAAVAGILFKTKKNLFRIEYAETNTHWYIHHVYNYEGYTYQGLSIGYPYGRNMQSLFFKHTFWLNSSLRITYKLGYYRAPFYRSSPPQEKVYYQEFYGEYFFKKHWKFGLFFKLTETKNYDTNPLPNQFAIVKEDKRVFIAGFSLSFHFGENSEQER